MLEAVIIAPLPQTSSQIQSWCKTAHTGYEPFSSIRLQRLQCSCISSPLVMNPKDWIRTFQLASLTLYVTIRCWGQGTWIHKHLCSYSHRGMREFWENGCGWGKSVSSEIKVYFPICVVLPWVLLLWLLYRNASEGSEPTPLLAIAAFTNPILLSRSWRHLVICWAL